MKRWIGYILRGALMGVGLQQLLALAVSTRLQLGYYMACFATLPEMAGREIQGVALQTAVSALAGTRIALALELWRQSQWLTASQGACIPRSSADRRAPCGAAVPVCNLRTFIKRNGTDGKPIYKFQHSWNPFSFSGLQSRPFKHFKLHAKKNKQYERHLWSDKAKP